jgi:hypothetical protein
MTHLAVCARAPRRTTWKFQVSTLTAQDTFSAQFQHVLRSRIPPSTYNTSHTDFHPFFHAAYKFLDDNTLQVG